MAAVRTLDLITYVDTDGLEWEEFAPGARRKTLFEDPATGQRTRLVEWEPGFHVPYVDRHPNGEYVYVLSGTFHDQNGRSGAGTYIHYLPGTEHQPWTEEGCTFLVIVPGSPSTGA